MSWYDYIFFWNYLEWWQSVLIFMTPVWSLIIYFIFAPIFDYFQRIGKSKACLHSENFLQSSLFGLNTYICGNIGAGKTTCGSAITNMLTKIKMKQAQQQVNHISNLMYEVDFNLVNQFISFAFKKAHLTNSDAIMNYLCDNYSELNDKLENKFYDNYLFPQSYYSLFREYIDAYLALIRNNYVYFTRRKFYCWITNNWAMKYTSDMIDVKDRFKNCDYQIQRYTTIFEDEKALTDKVNTNFREVAEKDGGGDEFFRLIRHFGESTINYITSVQDFNRVVKQERELATGIMYIRKREEMPMLSVSEILVNYAYEFLTQFKIIFNGFSDTINRSRERIIGKKIEALEKAISAHSDDEDFVCYCDSKKQVLIQEYNEVIKPVSMKPSKIKSLLFKLEKKMESFFADSYIRYQGDYYTTADDVGKRLQDCVAFSCKFDLCFPLCFAYGSTDTYAFSIANDYLSMLSIQKADYYNPDLNGIPFESDEDFADFVKRLFFKKGTFHRSNQDQSEIHGDTDNSSLDVVSDHDKEDYA